MPRPGVYRPDPSEGITRPEELRVLPIGLLDIGPQS